MQPQQSPTGEAPIGDRNSMLPFALVNFLNSLNIDVIIFLSLFHVVTHLITLFSTQLQINNIQKL